MDFFTYFLYIAKPKKIMWINNEYQTQIHLLMPSVFNKVKRSHMIKREI